MAIIYTKHAEEMLLHRDIEKNLVEETIKNPDKVVSEREGTKAYLKDFGKDYLRVVVAKQNENFTIVTLHWVAKKRVRE